jgi:hypothetical protein
MVYPTERIKVFQRDNNTCKKCGNKLHPDLLRVDHILRPQEGGSGEMHNLQTLCRTCHFQKHIEHREKMKVLEAPMSVTITIQLQPVIYEELKSVAAEYNNATFSELIGNLLHIRKYHYGRKEKDTMQIELWRGKGGLFSIFKFNDNRKKSGIYVQIFSRMEPRWAKIHRMTPQGFHAFMRSHNLAFVGKFDF